MIGEMHMTVFLEEQDGGGDFFCSRVTVASIFCLVRSTDGGENNRDAAVHRDV